MWFEPPQADTVTTVTLRTFQIDSVACGHGSPLVVIAGPCVLEAPQTNDLIGTTIRDICRDLGLGFIFKASFDKANRSSITSKRGPGIEQGLKELARLRNELSVPVTTDIHTAEQAALAANVADILQIPAFLCRQTDLLLACAESGKPVNVKKGQFLSPAEMKHVVAKLEEGGCDRIMLTERGTFFGYNRLVNDFIGIGDLLEFGLPVCFDITHSTQLPGAGTTQTAGRPERAALLARAAVAAGVHAVFIECHPNPAEAHSDSSTMQPLNVMDDLLRNLAGIWQAAASAPTLVQPGD